MALKTPKTRWHHEEDLVPGKEHLYGNHAE